MGRIALLLLALFADMKMHLTAGRAAPRPRRRGQGPADRPPLAHPEGKIEYARLLRAQGDSLDSLGVIVAKSGIPKTSLHRHLAVVGAER